LIVKQADALCAYLKCLEELSAGNNEFMLAKSRLEKTLDARRSPKWITSCKFLYPASIYRWMK
jgi:5'-deoxynucleotidase